MTTRRRGPPFTQIWKCYLTHPVLIASSAQVWTSLNHQAAVQLVAVIVMVLWKKVLQQRFRPTTAQMVHSTFTATDWIGSWVWLSQLYWSCHVYYELFLTNIFFRFINHLIRINHSFHLQLDHPSTNSVYWSANKSYVCSCYFFFLKWVSLMNPFSLPEFTILFGQLDIHH